MFEIKIKKKNPAWPFMLIGLVIIALIVYFLANKNKEELNEERKNIRESTINQSDAIMTPVNKELFFLSDLNDYAVADISHDVRGWALRDPENHLIGKVNDLLVDTQDRKVVYLEIEVDASVIEMGKSRQPLQVGDVTTVAPNRDGDDYLFYPVDWVIPDTERKTLNTKHIDFLTFVKAKRFNRSARSLPEYAVDQFRNLDHVSESIKSDRKL